MYFTEEFYDLAAGILGLEEEKRELEEEREELEEELRYNCYERHEKKQKRQVINNSNRRIKEINSEIMSKQEEQETEVL